MGQKMLGHKDNFALVYVRFLLGRSMVFDILIRWGRPVLMFVATEGRSPCRRQEMGPSFGLLGL